METKITGRIAITLAEMLGLPLCKYTDPTDDAETRAAGVSVEVAREIVKQDPSLVWIDRTRVADVISDDRISALRAEAVAAGDYNQADLCDRALSYDTTDQDGNQIPYADMSREAARVMCALAIASNA
jgi:hypothetical protein